MDAEFYLKCFFTSSKTSYSIRLRWSPTAEESMMNLFLMQYKRLFMC